MTISITYTSQRHEVWRWYWQAWRRRLWVIHVFIYVMTFISLSRHIYGNIPTKWTDFAALSAISLLPLAGLVAFPMLTFKPQARTLTIDEDGIATTIGKRSGTVSWAEIADIRDDGDTLIIQRRNLNAFIIPARAFDTAEARLQFRETVRAQILATRR